MSETLPAVVDGAVHPDGRVDVLVLGGGFQQGEGLFETLPLESGRPHFLRRHVARLHRGAEELALLPAPEESVWREDLERLVRATGKRDLAVRLFLFRDGRTVRRAVAASLLDMSARAAAVGLAERELQGPRPLARLKTLNYLAPRRALALGMARGLDEVLFLDHDGTILEGSRSTVFIVRDGGVRTCPLERPILPGVTREVLIEVAEEARIPVKLAGFGLAELEDADEVFLTASLRGVRPVATFEGRPVRAVEGPLTRRLEALYRKRVETEP